MSASKEQLLNEFIDGRLDPDATREFEAMLRADTDLSDKAEFYGWLKDALVEAFSEEGAAAVEAAEAEATPTPEQVAELAKRLQPPKAGIAVAPPDSTPSLPRSTRRLS